MVTYLRNFGLATFFHPPPPSAWPCNCFPLAVNSAANPQRVPTTTSIVPKCSHATLNDPRQLVLNVISTSVSFCFVFTKYVLHRQPIHSNILNVNMRKVSIAWFHELHSPIFNIFNGSRNSLCKICISPVKLIWRPINVSAWWLLIEFEEFAVAMSSSLV